MTLSQIPIQDITPNADYTGLYVRYQGVGNEPDQVFKITRIITVKQYGQTLIRYFTDGGKCGYGGHVIGTPGSQFVTFERQP